jgi:hypothetical protein
MLLLHPIKSFDVISTDYYKKDNFAGLDSAT